MKSDLGMTPQTEGQVIRLRVPEMNQQRRQEMVKVATSTPSRAGWRSATCGATAWTS